MPGASFTTSRSAGGAGAGCKRCSAEASRNGPTRTSSTGVDLRLSLRAALLALPARQRAVIVCRYFDDLTEAETAEVLDMAIGTVKSQSHRALAALRAAIPALELQLSGGEA